MRLTLEEYQSWVPDELDKFLRPTRKRAEKLVNDAHRALEEAEGFFQDLAGKGDRDMASKRDAASYRAARVIGHSGQVASDSLAQVQVPTEMSWESLRTLKDNISSASRAIRDIRNRTSMELSGFYILDMRSFSGHLDRVSKSGERLSAFLDGEGSNLQKAKTLTGIVESILVAKKELVERTEESAAILREKEQLRASIKELSTKIEQLVADNSLREVLDSEKELRKESRAFRTETLAHLQRPLRRLLDLSQRGDFAIVSEERDALTSFIQSPYKSFLSETTGHYLKPILENMEKALSSGKMEFKPRKTSRVSTRLKELTSSGSLLERQERGRRLLTRRRLLMKDPRCRTLYQKRKETVLRIEETKKLEENLAERYSSIQEMAENQARHLSELILLGERKTREYLGREVELEHPSLQILIPPSPV